MPGIAAVNLSKAFGAVRALDRVTLAVGEGELLAVVGPSGCGKTTLLRLIAGLERPDGGEIRIGGRDVLTLPAERRGVAMVFQSGALFPHMTVERNIRLAAPRERAVEVAGRLGLSGLLDRRPHELSTGQRQRAALARALARGAGAVLLDEPLASLDPPARRELRAEIRRAISELGAGAAAIHVTHDQEEAMAIGDRVAVMRDGRIEQVGTPEELYARPVSRFVARFVGDPMNFVPAEAVGAPRGAPVAGFRPSAVRRDDAGALRLAVEAVEPLGYETRVLGRLMWNGSGTGGSETVTARFDRQSGAGLRAGSEVRVSIEAWCGFEGGDEGRRMDA